MPMDRFPLVGSIGLRQQFGNVTDDQRFVGVWFSEVGNPQTGSKQLYANKRDGLALAVTPDSTAPKYIFYSPSRDNFYAAFGATNSTIYYFATPSTTTSIGTITGDVVTMNECVFSAITYLLITSSDKTAWFHASDATDTTIAGDTHTNLVIDNITGLTGSLYVGQKITGSGIQAGTRIASITSATAITTTLATTATATVTITVELIAKIIDADFPTDITGQFQEDSGFVFIMTQSGRIYNSDLNSVVAWTATSFIPVDSFTDGGVGLAKYKSMIVGFGKFSIEFFKNQGNPFASPLVRLDNSIQGIGCSAINGAMVCSGHDNVFWASESNVLYTFNGMMPKQIAPSGTSRFLQFSYTAGAFFVPQCFSLHGKRMVNFPYSSGNNGGLWYDVETQMCDFNGLPYAYIAGENTSGDCYAVQGAAAGTFGKIFKMASAGGTYTDNSVAFTMTIQTTKIDHGSEKRKFVPRIDLVADNQASGTTTLECSDDDYATWTTLGTFDMTKSQKSIYRCGSHKGGRAYRLTHSANTAWRGQFLDIYHNEGSG